MYVYVIVNFILNLNFFSLSLDIHYGFSVTRHPFLFML